MGQQFKRRRNPHTYTSAQMLATLVDMKLVALMQHSSIWLAVDPHTAWLLDMCCTGQKEGGPGTADEVAAVLGLQLPPPPPDVTDAAVTGEEENTIASKRVCLQPNESSSAVVEEGVSVGPVLFPPSGVDGSTGRQQQQQGEQQWQQGEQPVQQQQPQEQHQQGEHLQQQGAGPSTLHSEAEGQTAAASWRGGRGGRFGGRGAGRGRGRGRGQPVFTLLEMEPWRAVPHAFVSIRLTLEEAFFLYHVLGCLSVKEAVKTGAHQQQQQQQLQQQGQQQQQQQQGQQKRQQQGNHSTACQEVEMAKVVSSGVQECGTLVELDAEGLWHACYSIRASFPTSYVAYHQLKSKGWLPRSGLLYGTDFTLYQMHPSVMHSTFSVVVMPLLQQRNNDSSAENGVLVNGNSSGSVAAGLGQAARSHRALDWHDLQITARVVGTVAKKLLLLYLVELPTSPGLHTLRCLEHFTVEERLVRRWVPDATRD